MKKEFSNDEKKKNLQQYPIAKSGFIVISS